VATVLVLPDTSWTGRAAVIERVTHAVGVRGGNATEVCADLMRLAPQPPLIIVAHGSGCALLPAVALAQRTAHRRVGAYVLVDPDAPAGSDTWPDAPVYVVSTDQQITRMSTLRGWSVVDDDVIGAITRVVEDCT
jgi:hypothetical protein